VLKTTATQATINDRATRTQIEQQNADTNAARVAAQEREANARIAQAQARAAQTGQKVDVALSRATGEWVNSSGEPIQGMGGAPKPPALTRAAAAKQPGVYGTAPHQNNAGVWVNSKGVRLSPAGQAYWNHLRARGITDGAGHIKKTFVP